MWSSGPSKDEYEDEKEPKTVEDFEKLAQTYLRDLEEWKASSDWSLVEIGVAGVTLHERQVPGYEIPMMKLEAIVPGTVDEVYSFLESDKFEERKQYDDFLKHFEIIEQITPKIATVYVQYSAIFPVSNRDFIAFKAEEVLPDGTRICFGHTIRNAAKPITNSFVRAKGRLASFCSPIPGEHFKTRVVKFLLIDPMGTIPKFVVSKGKAMAGIQIRKVNKILTQRYGSPDRVPSTITSSPTGPTIDGEDTDSEEGFWDAAEGEDDHGRTELSHSQTRHAPVPTVIATTAERVVQDRVMALVSQMQQSLTSMKDRLDQLELPDRNSRASWGVNRRGVFLSWTSFFVMMAWPVITLLLYHSFLKRRKLISSS